MSRAAWFWFGVALITLAFAGSVFSVLVLVVGVEIWKALMGTAVALLIVGVLAGRDIPAKPMVMNESKWLDVEGEKE